MTRAVAKRHDPWAGNPPGFNRQVADVIFKAMTAMEEDEARLFGQILLAGTLNYDLMTNYGEIVKTVEGQTHQRAAALRQHFSREAVAKERRGEDSSRELRYLVEIGKAFDFTTGQRSQYARGRTREHGRFAVEHHQIMHNEGLPPREPEHAAAMGIPKADNLAGKDQSHYQQAYQQVRDLISPYSHPSLNALLHLHVEGRDGEVRTDQYHVVNGKTPKIHEKLRDGDRIKTASVSVHPTVTAGTTAFGAMSGLGVSPQLGARASMAAEHVTGAGLREYNAAAEGFTGNEPYSGTSRAFGRMQRGHKLLNDSFGGENAPRKLQYALAVANHVGQFGPEAQKVIGPIADRTAYRYRGTERPPSRGLQIAFQTLHNDETLKTPVQRRNRAVQGRETEDGWVPGSVLTYFRNHLPDPDLNELQRKSGVIPPSEGIIVNRNGEVMAQSVGYADDWYLPFNLRHLGALKGGEYIRTRTFGGPTTEDIYTGLISGARSLTVVSHNGVYNIEFDRNLRGGRRFNDKAARMVGRYGQLLDALRSKRVQRGDISASRLHEMRGDLAKETTQPEGSAAFNDLMERRKAGERLDPKLSRQERDDAALDWLQQAAARQHTRDGRTMTVDELYSSATTKATKIEYKKDVEDFQAQGLPNPFSEDQVREQVATRLIHPDNRELTARNVASVLGGKNPERFEQHMERAVQENIDRVSPLQLNGKGYEDGLLALKEQFPYYIESVSFKPWTDAAVPGDTRGSKRTDTGYVLPRHNRPAAAQAGYFSARVNGPAGGRDEEGRQSGKVRADTIRYQNRRVNRAGPEPIQRGNPDSPAGAYGTGGANRPPNAPTGGLPAGLGGGQIGGARGRQVAADQDMLSELWSKTKFGPGANLPGKDEAGNPKNINYSGGDIQTEVRDGRFPPGPVQEFYGQQGGLPALQAKLGNPEEAEKLHLLMEQILHLSTGPTKLFDIRPTVAQTFLARGATGTAQNIPANWIDRLDQLHQDHNFSSRSSAFDAASMPTVDHVRSAFEGDAELQDLLGRNANDDGTPFPKIHEANFGDEISGLAEGIKGAVTTYQAHRNRGGAADPAQERDFEADTLAVMRGAQLHRRHLQAVRNAPPPAAPAHPAGGTTTINQRLVMSPRDLLDLSPKERQEFHDMMRAENFDVGVDDDEDPPEHHRIIDAT